MNLPPHVACTELRRWIQCVQSSISVRLNAFRKQDAFLRGCVRALALFHRMNEKLKARYDATNKFAINMTDGMTTTTTMTGIKEKTTLPYLDRSYFLNDSITSLDTHLASDYRDHLAGLRAAEAEREATELLAAYQAEHVTGPERELAIGGDDDQPFGWAISDRTSITSASTSELRLSSYSVSDDGQHARKKIRIGSKEQPIALTTSTDAIPTSVIKRSYPPPPKNPNATPVKFPRQFAFSSYPFLLDASNFSRILLTESQREQQELLNRAAHSHTYWGRRGHHHHHQHQQHGGALVLNVRRTNLVQDSLHQIHRLAHSDELKRPLKVVFANEEGQICIR